MITPYNLLRHELIGLKTEVVGSPDKNQVGLTGEITGETKNTITLKTKEHTKKTIQKNQSKLRIQLPQEAVVEISASLLTGRPSERIKKKIRLSYVK